MKWHRTLPRIVWNANCDPAFWIWGFGFSFPDEEDLGYGGHLFIGPLILTLHFTWPERSAA